MSHQLKSRYLTTHDINGQERKCLLAKAHFSVLSSQPEQALPQSDSTPGQVVPGASLHFEVLTPECGRECLETRDCKPARHVGAG